MTTNTKKNLTLISLLLIAFLIIGGILVISNRLATQRAVAPTAPESKPQAAEWVGGAACNTSFTIAAAATPGTCSQTCSTNQPCASGLTCVGGMCRNAACTGQTDCVCPTATPTPTPATCNNSCNPNANPPRNCTSGLTCVPNAAGSSEGMCRNPSCTGVVDCTCPTATPTPTATAAPTATTPPTLAQGTTPTVTPTTAPKRLPDAGIGLPTVAAMGGGLVMVLLGILFAL